MKVTLFRCDSIRHSGVLERKTEDPIGEKWITAAITTGHITLSPVKDTSQELSGASIKHFCSSYCAVEFAEKYLNDLLEPQPQEVPTEENRIEFYEPDSIPNSKGEQENA